MLKSIKSQDARLLQLIHQIPLPVFMKFLFLIVLFSLVLEVRANPADSLNRTNSISKRQYVATKIQTSPKIDGRLEDPLWLTIPTADQFIALEPTPFIAMSKPTEVKLAYDDQAIYVYARLHDDSIEIRRDLSQRDQVGGNTDWFSVNFDCFNDDQNGIRFMVTAAGVQADARVGKFELGNGNGWTNIDYSWDAIWESAVSIQPDGWAVEMKIPYMALRFPKTKNQTWGLQFSRHIKRFGETGSWQTIDPKVDGMVFQWGDLTGLENIQPPLRLSLSPYIANTYTHTPYTLDGGIRYAGQNTFSGGLDLKYGINESFTLDATLVPNFGQVQSDNRVLNLSPFEVKFDERRPFFTEGTELFNKGDIFYSRRVGGTPDGFWNVQDQLQTYEVIESNPAETQLYNATKISGRTNKNLGIGFFNAVAAPMYAIVKNTASNTTRKIQTSSLTNYNVTVISQALKNNSEISFTNASTMRNGSSRDANVSAARVRLRDKLNKYEVSLGGRTSQVFHPGEEGLVAGYTGDWALQKVSGKLTWSIDQSLQTNTWNPDDLGIFTGNNYVNSHLGLYYNEFKPTKTFLQYQTWFNLNLNQRYKPFDFQDLGINTGFWGKFKNQSWANYWLYTQPVWTYDYFEPRFAGKKFKLGPFFNNGMNYGSDERKKFELYLHLGTYIQSWGELPAAFRYQFVINPAYRLSKKLRVNANVFFQHYNNSYGYAGDAGEHEIVFGRRTRENLESSFNVRYNFNTKMDLSFRARHYWSKVMYHSYFNLMEDGKLEPREWNNNADLNINFFNIDMVYTWQFSAGSFINVIWKNSISRDQYGTEVSRQESYFDNFSHTWNSPQTNNLTVKMIYFLDFNKAKALLKGRA